MKLPPFTRILRPAIIILGIYALIWMALEGNLIRDVTLAAGTTVVILLYLARRFPGGRAMSGGVRLLSATLFGLALGLGSGVMTLLLMALKTGLHTHGPEYTTGQIAWVWGQLPLWTAAGALAGLGVGLITIGLGSSRR